MVDDAIAEAHRRMEKLYRKFEESDDEEEQTKFSRAIGAWGTVFAFEFQDPYEAARYVSKQLIEQANDSEAERARQAAAERMEQLRKLQDEQEAKRPRRGKW